MANFLTLFPSKMHLERVSVIHQISQSVNQIQINNGISSDILRLKLLQKLACITKAKPMLVQKLHMIQILFQMQVIVLQN